MGNGIAVVQYVNNPSGRLNSAKAYFISVNQLVRLRPCERYVNANSVIAAKSVDTNLGMGLNNGGTNRSVGLL